MTATADDRDDGFLSRWARRKAEVRHGGAAAAPATAAAPPMAPEAKEAPAPPPAAVAPGPAPGPQAPPPTMDDVARLTRGCDFSPFVSPGVDEGVKRAALKKLFADPRFNVMDGLDVYIDDYHTPDPLPASMLRAMVQSKALGLFADEAAAAPAPTAAGAPTDASPAAPQADEIPEAPPDEDADLRLQPHDAAGREGAGAGAVDDAGRER